MRKNTLKTKFVVLLCAAVTACLCVNLLWSYGQGEKQTERELLQQARALSANMSAVWDFMTVNQKLINYDSQGNYEFKGLQCSIAGRSIGSLFSAKTDYETRYVSENPRNNSDLPDEFEIEALTAFAANTDLVEYYRVDSFQGNQVFRYLAPMKIEKSCLTCHGDPAGELDETGYPKEGMKEGDLYGALSLFIPMDAYTEASHENAFAQAVFSFTLVALCAIAVYTALSVLVTRPLSRLSFAMHRVGEGCLSTRMEDEKSSLEASDLAECFNRMAGQLQDMQDTLEMQVAERTEALEHANAVLEEQRRHLEDMNRQLTDDSRFKSDFLAMMSHELRTPLAAAMTFADVLKKRSEPQNEEENKLWCELEQNNKVLLSLINNILEMARIDAGKEALRLELVDVGDVTGFLKAVAEPLANKRDVRLEYSVDENTPLFVADSEKLRRIVENLVSNAIKFTPEGGLVRVCVSHDVSRRMMVIKVSDTGIGIEKEKLKVIFERFVQVDASSSRSYGGSGLGLALVRELAVMHGGVVHVESELGYGSVFTVEIPSNLDLDDAIQGERI